jgi:hypothetical protein
MKGVIFAMIVCVCLCGSGCQRKIFFQDEVRPGEGQIYYKYINTSLKFHISLFGDMQPVLNPNKKDIDTWIGTSNFLYKIRHIHINHKEDILLNNDKSKEGIHQLFQAYAIDDKFDLAPFVENYRKSILSKNLICLNDSSTKMILQDVPFCGFKYTLKSQEKRINIEEYFCVQNKYLIRYLFLRKNGSTCLNDALTYEASRILSTFQNNLLSSVRPHQLFIDSKFNYLEPLSQLNRPPVTDKELLATYSSYVGDIKKALHYKPYNSKNRTASLDSAYLTQYSPIEATELPHLIPDSCRVLMINEDHINPYTRIFMRDLLEPLQKKGFKVFAAETLSAYDTIFPYHKLKQGTGFYISEPNYGNLLRSAMYMGYTIYNYENGMDYDSTTRLSRAEFREFQQAKNLVRIVQDSNHPKIIVFAGHGHIKKKGNTGRKMMASFFKDLTGITPFCIDQTVMTEADSSHKEHPVYTYIERTYQPKQSIVLKTKDNQLFVEESARNSVDVQVFHPRTIFDKNNYALWLLNKGSKQQPFSFKGKQFFNTLFQIFDHKEYENLGFNAIPMLNLPLNGDNEFEIALSNGVYSVMVFDRHRNLLFNKIITLK